jgi:DNA-binding transcriptional ArsR family regulator
LGGYSYFYFFKPLDVAYMQEASELDKIDFEAAKAAASKIRSINHGRRLQIIKLLDDRRRMNVSDIYAKLRLQQADTSQHLGILRSAGMVHTKRSGKQIYYSLNYAGLEEVNLFAEKLNSGLI